MGGGFGGGLGGGFGGGTGGGGTCNSSNCAGCCSPIDDICVSYAFQDTFNCGGFGNTCGTCQNGQVCSLSSQGCVTSTTPDAGPEAGRTGMPCTTDNQCGFGINGNLLRCRFSTAEGNGSYPGGYCTKDCDTAVDACAGDATCVKTPSGWGETTALCMPACDPSNDQCRSPDYQCYPVDTAGVCWLVSHPDIRPDGGPTPTTIGNACTTATDCQNPPSAGVYCIRAPDGGVADGYVDGYCARNCSEPEYLCSTNGSAICVNFGDTMTPFLECADVCNKSTDGGAIGDCRVGYICEGPSTWPDGGVATTGFCIPNCNNAGAAWVCPAANCQPDGRCL
jgi:hypothetical protein